MMERSASEVLFIAVNHSITLMGKMWLIVMVFLRILMVIFAGYPLYQDEQERFVCNTIQPGCANVCFDLFSPISLFRFWLVQFITLCLPYVFFIIYVAHKVLNSLPINSSVQVQAMPFIKIHHETPISKISLAGEGQNWQWCFIEAYLIHLTFRSILEAAFGAAHYYLFGFSTPKMFLCQHVPCTTQVDCYISRPTEKTLMLNFMLTVAAFSLILNLFDLICIVRRSLTQKGKRKLMEENIYEEERTFLSTGGVCKGSDIPASHGHQDLHPEASLSASFRKRRGNVFGGGQELPCLESLCPPGTPEPPACNTNGNNGHTVRQEETQKHNSSDMGQCLTEPQETPKIICVSKRSRLKPPPPPRRGLGLISGELPRPMRDNFTVTTIRSHCNLKELGSRAELHISNDNLEKSSQWV